MSVAARGRPADLLERDGTPILRRLNARTREDAVADAGRLGVTPDPESHAERAPA